MEEILKYYLSDFAKTLNKRVIILRLIVLVIFVIIEILIEYLRARSIAVMVLFSVILSSYFLAKISIWILLYLIKTRKPDLAVIRNLFQIPIFYFFFTLTIISLGFAIFNENSILVVIGLLTGDISILITLMNIQTSRTLLINYHSNKISLNYSFENFFKFKISIHKSITNTIKIILVKVLDDNIKVTNYGILLKPVKIDKENGSEIKPKVNYSVYAMIDNTYAVILEYNKSLSTILKFLDQLSNHYNLVNLNYSNFIRDNGSGLIFIK